MSRSTFLGGGEEAVLRSLIFCPDNLARAVGSREKYQPTNLKEVLEESNPVVLVLVLTLVSIGRPSAGAHGSKKLVLLAFLLSICHSQKYEEKHGEMMM